MGNNPASPHGGAQEELMARVDTSVPVSARIWNYWMGGTDYYPIDKQAGINTDPEQNKALEQYNASGAIPYHVREPEQVRRFFDGLELVEPGVVPIHQWHPDPGTVDPPAVPALGGIGRKP